MAKRDNDYYARRLQRDHPHIWHAFQAGIYKSLAEARRAAGLGGSRTRVHELKNAWNRATAEERDEFRAFLDAEGVALPLSGPTSTPTPTTAPIAGSITSAPATGIGTIAKEGRLAPEARSRINQIIDRRGLRGRFGEPRIGVIMQELIPPFSPRDASLGSALARGTRLRKDMVEALERWVAGQACP